MALTTKSASACVATFTVPAAYDLRYADIRAHIYNVACAVFRRRLGPKEK